MIGIWRNQSMVGKPLVCMYKTTTSTMFMWCDSIWTIYFRYTSVMRLTSLLSAPGFGKCLTSLLFTIDSYIFDGNLSSLALLCFLKDWDPTMLQRRNLQYQFHGPSSYKPKTNPAVLVEDPKKHRISVSTSKTICNTYVSCIILSKCPLPFRIHTYSD